VALCVALAASHKLPTFTMKDAPKLFQLFIKDHHLTFKSAAARKHRYAIFKKNLAIIIRENGKNGTAKLHIGPHAHLTPEEFQKWRTGWGGSKKGPKREVEVVATSDAMKRAVLQNPPASRDWRQNHKVGPVRDQGNCGSCWAYSGSGTLESNWAIKHGKLVPLSPQHILDCVPPSGINGCDWARKQDHSDAMWAFKYAAKKGIHTLKSYPISSKTLKSNHDGKCKHKKGGIGARTSGPGYTVISGGHDAIKAQVGNVGPVVITVDVSGSIWPNYHHGIISRGSTNINHQIELVGYGSVGGKDVWIIKNSWGKKWGMNGFGYIARTKDKNGVCGMYTWVLAPVV